MTKDEIEKRMLELKMENDKANQELIYIEQRKQVLLQEILVRNGRILELQRLNAPPEETKKWSCPAFS